MKKKILIIGFDEPTVSELANSLAKQLRYGVEEAETVLKNAAKSYEGFKVELYKLQNPL